MSSHCCVFDTDTQVADNTLYKLKIASSYRRPGSLWDFQSKRPVSPAVTLAVLVGGLTNPQLNNNTGTQTEQFRNMHIHCELRREACTAWDKSGSCKNILRDCCEILKTHLLGIEFLMTLNENGAVKVFCSCASPTFYNPTETLRWHGRVVKEGLMEMNGTMWKSHFIVLY